MFVLFILFTIFFTFVVRFNEKLLTCEKIEMKNLLNTFNPVSTACKSFNILYVMQYYVCSIHSFGQKLIEKKTVLIV